MSDKSTATGRLRRIFLNSITAADLAENLISFDDTAATADVAAVARSARLRVVGVRQGGVVTGYAPVSELSAGSLANATHRLEAADIIPASASIPQLVEALDQRTWIFVEIFDRVGGIVTRTDIQKPAMRMWLFGMITILEMNITWAIERLYPDDGWVHRISAGRVEKARALMEERKRRKQDCRLIDCLQFSDRGYILIHDDENWRILGYESRRQAEKAIKAIESLRNNLAHSQNIITYDWDTIMALVRNIDTLLAREGVTRLLTAKGAQAGSAILPNSG